MNNNINMLNKVFEISDLLYSQEKEKIISKLNDKLERDFKSGSATYNTLQAYFMVILEIINTL